MSSLPERRPRISGFTLIEMLITLAIVAILAAVAYPSYQSAVRKGRRADAMAALAKVMQAQERWRSEHASYQSTLSSLEGVTGSSADGHYTVSLAEGSVSATGYTTLATAKSTSPQNSDTACRVMQVAVSGGSITYSSQTAGGQTNAAPDPCWIK